MPKDVFKIIVLCWEDGANPFNNKGYANSPNSGDFRITLEFSSFTKRGLYTISNPNSEFGVIVN